MNKNSKNLSNYLRELRQSFDYSQEFVASHLDIIRQTYSHYETGRVVPPTDALYKLAELYKIPVSKLVELTVSDSTQVDYYTVVESPVDENLTLFLEYINSPDKKTAFKGLSRVEREMLFYFQHINKEQQEDILDFMKIKYKRITKK